MLSGAPSVRVREVKLWGRVVLIDSQHDVWCEDCCQFVPAVELGRVDNYHRVGLVPRTAGRLLPMTDDGDEPPPRDMIGEF